ncbi:hypothetical protein NDU88_003151 [Pleurodeles waltl]|uniref:Uncharacterized protein n=1 Tax=Pleurodeles waltl TaxID=8319 RepID=A0AAV7SE06_PLEWA|nr:hypothetical protein NDU88_003151 [Pleurodeles waltl]
MPTSAKQGASEKDHRSAARLTYQALYNGLRSPEKQLERLPKRRLEMAPSRGKNGGPNRQQGGEELLPITLDAYER